MHIHKTKKLIKTALYAAIISCAAGAATGTYAWYAYQKDVNVDLSGTTIKADKEIQIGLRSATSLTAFENKYTLGEIVKETGVKYNSSDADSFNIYWIRGNFVTQILKDFQEAIGSAQGRLEPITAGKYEKGWAEDKGNTTPAADTWNGFKATPSHREGYRKWTKLVNDYQDYFYLPLAFRVIPNEGSEYVNNEKIYLTEFKTTDKDKGATSVDLAQAVRCKVDYPSHADTSDNFIFDPNADSAADLAVGGVLNLQPDIYYDYDLDTKKEIAYGEFDNAVSWKSTATSADPALDFENCTTFSANHLKGGYEVDLTASQPSTCETLAKTGIVDAGFTGNGLTTTTDAGNYAYADLSIYLEGWDTNIVNLSAGRTFAVELQFSIE